MKTYLKQFHSHTTYSEKLTFLTLCYAHISFKGRFSTSSFFFVTCCVIYLVCKRFIQPLVLIDHCNKSHHKSDKIRFPVSDYLNELFSVVNKEFKDSRHAVFWKMVFLKVPCQRWWYEAIFVCSQALKNSLQYKPFAEYLYISCGQLL